MALREWNRVRVIDVAAVEQDAIREMLTKRENGNSPGNAKYLEAESPSAQRKLQELKHAVEALTPGSSAPTSRVDSPLFTEDDCEMDTDKYSDDFEPVEDAVDIEEDIKGEGEGEKDQDQEPPRVVDTPTPPPHHYERSPVATPSPVDLSPLTSPPASPSFNKHISLSLRHYFCPRCDKPVTVGGAGGHDDHFVGMRPSLKAVHTVSGQQIYCPIAAAVTRQRYSF